MGKGKLQEEVLEGSQLPSTEGPGPEYELSIQKRQLVFIVLGIAGL